MCLYYINTARWHVNLRRLESHNAENCEVGLQSYYLQVSICWMLLLYIRLLYYLGDCFVNEFCTIDRLTVACYEDENIGIYRLQYFLLLTYFILYWFTHSEIYEHMYRLYYFWRIFYCLLNIYFYLNYQALIVWLSPRLIILVPLHKVTSILNLNSFSACCTVRKIYYCMYVQFYDKFLVVWRSVNCALLSILWTPPSPF